MRVADYLMAHLADLGAREVFFLPGGGAMHLDDGLACEKRLVPIPCHHEQACGIAAEAWGRIRQTFGVCVVTTGPGATNVITPVAGAWIESVPMLILSGQVKRADRIGTRSIRQGGVQEVDIVPMVRHITKYAVTVEDPSHIRYHLERALHEMLAGRPGPVWLDIPLDIQGAQVDPDTLAGYTPLSTEQAAGNTDDACRETLKLLASASRPLLLAGHGVRLAGAAQSFVKLAETLDVPVVTTWNALDLLPWEHPLNIGRPGVVALRASNFAVQNCDLLISIGSRLDNVITAYNPGGFARAAKKVVIDVDSAEIDKLDMDIAVRAVADAGAFIDTLLQHMSVSSPRDSQRTAWIERCLDWKRRYPENDGMPFPSTGSISHYHFVSALSDAVPTDTCISTGSSGLAIEAFYTIFRNKPGQRVFLTSGLGSMGYGLPAAIGACLANDRKPMVALESDGSLQLNLQELATLAALQLPISLIIMNNAGYASIRNTQRNYFDSRFLGTGPEAGLMLPDLEKLASVYGLPYLRMEKAEELDALAPTLASGRLQLIDVRLVPNETLAPKVAAIPQANGGMLSMPLEDMSPLLPWDTLTKEMCHTPLPASRMARHLPDV